MIFVNKTQNDDELEEEETEAGIDESMLDEISEDAAVVDETEGFGHIKEEGDDEEEEEEKEAEVEEDPELEDDAEDVDYDSFDDEDHL